MADVEKQLFRKRHTPVKQNGHDGRMRLFSAVPAAFVPSSFTVMNMVCGYIAIVMSGEGSFVSACWFIVLASVFDTLDGFVARMTNGISDFGVELDSLSDLVSFGAAPAYLAYRFALEGMPYDAGVFLSALIMVGSGLRLARFNISLGGCRKESFSGLPSPAQALTIAGFVLWVNADVPRLPSGVVQQVLAGLVIALSLLMVSKVNYDALPRPTVDVFRRKPLQMAFYAAAILAVLLFHAKAFFLVMLSYILLGVIRALTLLLRQKRL